MTIPENDWVRYISRLSRISKKAADLMQEYIDKHGTENRRELISYAYELSATYGEAAASLTCEMYDALSGAQGAGVRSAEMVESVTERETAKAILGTMKNKDNSVPQTVGRLVKQAGADTALKNAQRDGAEFAWVPHGDTCPFCIMLASRGWQRISKKALKNGHAEHIHANCDCTFAVRFDGKSSVEGYEPEKYREIYDNAEGNTPEEKVKAIRQAEEKVRDSSFHTFEDPIREKIGSAYESHPKEMKRIEKMLKGKGVEIVARPGCMSYSANSNGTPGRIIMDPEASYSAWLHELKHLSDDEDSGWNLYRMVIDPEAFAALEDAAYDIEIDFARQNGYNKIVRRLERLKFERRQEILGIQRNNKQAHE